MALLRLVGAAGAATLAATAFGVVSLPTVAVLLAVVAVVVAVLWELLRMAVHRDLTLVATHWSRNPDACNPLYSKTSHRLKHNWVFECSKSTSTDGPLTGTCIGRQTWRPDPTSSDTSEPFVAEANPSSSDQLLRRQHLTAAGDTSPPIGAPERGGAAAASTDPKTALREAHDFYAKLQAEDGHWAGDYGGPHFLTPGLIFTCYITGHDLGPARRDAMITYFRNHQQQDGGWGLHIESPSTMFGSVMTYTSLRLLGVPATAPYMELCHKWIQANGGATTIPSWGKFWLAALGVYEWEGLNPLPPELWLLPYAFPFHPARMWCHCRMVYLPMSYVYGLKASAPLSDVTRALRQELYTRPYDTINWNAARFEVCTHDLYSPHTWICDRLFDALALYERCANRWLRRRGLAFAAEYIQAEDEQTNYVDIGPVNKVINMLAVWYATGGPNGGSKSDRFLRHAARVEDYLWVAEDGMKMNGYNGSQLWDTAFTTQALLESGITDHCRATIARAHTFIADTQIKEDVPQRSRFFRHISKGGWPFSTSDHGWPISDCTAEGLKSALGVRKAGLVPADQLIPVDRLHDAVNILLSYQNAEGGWATYELNRGWDWYEWFNPAEVFGDIMIDYSYVECSSACITALAAFHEQFPDHRGKEVQTAISRGADCIRSLQRADGSWYGSWAVCFTYAGWFGVEGLRAAGEPLSSDRFRRSSEFLLSKQNPDGGWGETYLSCVTKEYVGCESMVVQTGWALLALIRAECPNVDAVRRGVQFLLAKQLVTGDWPQERVCGIFNRTCSISYTSYRNTFPMWALGVYTNDYVPEHPELAGSWSGSGSGGDAGAGAGVGASAARRRRRRD